MRLKKDTALQSTLPEKKAHLQNHKVRNFCFKLHIKVLTKDFESSNTRYVYKALGTFVNSSPYFILDVLFRVKSPKTTYTRIYGCYSSLLGGSRVRSMEWFVDVCSNEK